MQALHLRVFHFFQKSLCLVLPNKIASNNYEISAQGNMVVKLWLLADIDEVFLVTMKICLPLDELLDCNAPSSNNFSKK